MHCGNPMTRTAHPSHGVDDFAGKKWLPEGVGARPINREVRHCAPHTPELVSAASARPRGLVGLTEWLTMAEERLIRKYANRRLYDAHDSRHVTLDDLRKLIAGGERIKVVDDKSGEDLTRSILLQIIASQEQFGTPVLSTQLLEAIIRFY